MTCQLELSNSEHFKLVQKRYDCKGKVGMKANWYLNWWQLVKLKGGGKLTIWGIIMHPFIIRSSYIVSVNGLKTSSWKLQIFNMNGHTVKYAGMYTFFKKEYTVYCKKYLPLTSWVPSVSISLVRFDSWPVMDVKLPPSHDIVPLIPCTINNTSHGFRRLLWYLSEICLQL